jgi:hypothetical protein
MNEIDTIINEFISKWCGLDAPYLLDGDENPGERLRQTLKKREHKAYLQGVKDLKQNVIKTIGKN